MNDIEKQAERYRKLRGWMSSNVEEGWSVVEELGAVACWLGWQSFEEYLDSLPECNVGLMHKAKENTNES